MNDLFEGLGFLARIVLGTVRFVVGLVETLMAFNEIGGWLAKLWKRLRGKRDEPKEPDAQK